jgi:stearoyl-CoA desaturase (delta-9 desaturase)
MNLVGAIFIIGYHLIGLYGLCILPNISWYNIYLTIFMCVFSGFGITMGYHRLWSHRSFKAKPILQIILALGGASAIQGSCIWWSKLHRLHHYRSDTEDDPYGPQKGFLYSHILWIFENRQIEALKRVDISDLKNNWILKYQHKYYPYIALFGSIGIPFAITLIYTLIKQIDFTYDIFIQTLVYPIAFARIITWHSTWFVNSLAHTFGNQTYGKSGTSRDHLFTALLTFGEGNHNFHHEFPFDWRNAIKWYQYDPTKWLIKLLHYMNLTYDLKEAKKEVIQMNINHNLNIHKKKEYHILTRSDINKMINTNKSNNIVIYNNKVYDLTPLLGYHPGGDNFIKSIINKKNIDKPDTDILSIMNKINIHSQGAMNLLETMKIADIDHN